MEEIDFWASFGQDFEASLEGQGGSEKWQGSNTSRTSISGSYLRDWGGWFGRVSGAFGGSYYEERRFSKNGAFASMFYQNIPEVRMRGELDLGIGRVREGGYAFTAIQITEELARKNLLSQEPTKAVLEELSRAIALRREQESFALDNREYGIETVRILGGIFEKFSLLKPGFEPFIIIQDAYLYSNETRGMGSEYYLFGSFENKKTQGYTINSAAWYRNIYLYPLPKIGMAYHAYHPILNHWQLDWGGKTNWEEWNMQGEDIDQFGSDYYENKTSELHGEGFITLEYYPDTRNALGLSFQFYLDLGREIVDTNDPTFFAYDYIEPQAQLSAHWIYELNYNLDITAGALISYSRKFYQNPEKNSSVIVEWDSVDDAGNWNFSSNLGLNYRFFKDQAVRFAWMEKRISRIMHAFLSV